MNKYADKVPTHREKMAAVMNRMRGAAKACIRKTVYPTEEAAKKAVKSLSLKFKCPMRHYHCPHCLNWHLSKEKK